MASGRARRVWLPVRPDPSIPLSCPLSDEQACAALR